MRDLLTRLTRVLPLTAVASIGGCGVTSLQLQDFAYSTVIRALAQSVVSLIEAAVLGAAAGGG
jgi:hypothetical protein